MAIKTSADLKNTLISHLRFLQKSPERVRSFFCAPATQFALSSTFHNDHINNLTGFDEAVGASAIKT